VRLVGACSGNFAQEDPSITPASVDQRHHQQLADSLSG
jgi:hypothetical protein